MCSTQEIWSCVWNIPRNQVWFKTKYFWVSGANFPKKGVLKTEFKKKIAKFRISILEYPCVLSFIWNKALWSFGTNFTQNKYFGNRIWENNCQVQNEHPWIQLRTEFHSKQSTLKFREQVRPKKVFWGQNLRKQLSNSESTPLATSVSRVSF